MARTSNNKSLQELRDSSGSEPSTQPIYQVKQEIVGVEIEPIQVTQDDIGESWIVGSATNGIVGANTSTQSGNQQVVGGSGRVQTVQKVSAYNNTVIQRFNVTTLKDASTTCTWSGNGELSFTAGEIALSLSTYKGSLTIRKATLYVNNATNLTLQLSADGGSNFETVSNNVEHTFTNTGSDLRFKLTASGNATVTYLRIKFA